MGFTGGGGGALPAHQHTNTPLSGGPLDLSNVTVGSLAQGSVVFSDGAALQELVKPAVPAGEVLSYPALATAPSWGSASSAVTLTRATATLAVAFTTSSTSFVDIPNLTHTMQAGSGACICTFSTTIQGTQNGFVTWNWSVDGVSADVRTDYNYNMITFTAISTTLSSQIAVAQLKRAGASGSITVSQNNENSVAYWLEIS